MYASEDRKVDLRFGEKFIRGSRAKLNRVPIFGSNGMLDDIAELISFKFKGFYHHMDLNASGIAGSF